MPRYDFACFECRTIEEREVSVSERDTQKCAHGHPMKQRIDFGSISFVCYGQDSPYDPKFTGPRQKRRWEAENHQWDASGESLDSVKRQQSAWKQSAEEQKVRDYEKTMDGIFTELGDAAFTRVKHQTPPRDFNPGPGEAGWA